MSSKTIPVFFYGLFMDEALLHSKDVSVSDPVVAHVDGYCLHIGARATLLPDEGGRAYGVVAEVSTDELARLYKEPSVADYIAADVTATVPGGTDMKATCYILPPEQLAGANPEYATALLELASKLGFPDDYLDQIRRVS